MWGVFEWNRVLGILGEVGTMLNTVAPFPIILFFRYTFDCVCCLKTKPS